jgi:hypothetical protein
MKYSLLLVLLLNVAQAQPKPATEPQPPSIKLPTVNCSDAETAKACSSFKQLLDAQDKDILKNLYFPSSYVCFRPKDDAFLIFHIGAPGPKLWKKWEKVDVGPVETQSGFPALTEFREGVFYHEAIGMGDWTRYNNLDTLPTFTLRPNGGNTDGMAIVIGETEISVTYPFKNRNDETTQYELTIRRSTGRFSETFAVNEKRIVIHSGTCLIYQ